MPSFFAFPCPYSSFFSPAILFSVFSHTLSLSLFFPFYWSSVLAPAMGIQFLFWFKLHAAVLQKML